MKQQHNLAVWGALRKSIYGRVAAPTLEADHVTTGIFFITLELRRGTVICLRRELWSQNDLP